MDNSNENIDVKKDEYELEENDDETELAKVNQSLQNLQDYESDNEEEEEEEQLTNNNEENNYYQMFENTNDTNADNMHEDNVDDNANDDDDNDNADDVDENALFTEFLQQVFEAKRMIVNKRKENKFIPSTEKYLTSSFDDKVALIKNKNIKDNLLYLCSIIVDKKIDIEVARVDRGLMQYLLAETTSKKDIELHLQEDFRLNFYFREALDVLKQFG